MLGHGIREHLNTGRTLASGLSGRPVDRRGWLQMAGGMAAGLGGLLGCPDPSPAAEDRASNAIAEAREEVRRAEARAMRVTNRLLRRLDTAHYQAIGDASDAFIKLTLSDCEQIAVDYLNHFREKGFDVKLPDRRLTVVLFVDERPFLRFAENVPRGTVGFYSQPQNWLALFDFRNVPMAPYASGQTNMETVSHEATHQLTFNTGLFDRQGDNPRCIVEGVGMYCERRKLTGRSEPGQLNLRRLEELAHGQRRTRWIPISNLLADDRDWYGNNADRMTLGYAESWLMVYHLMTNPQRLPQFRDYLGTLRRRTDRNHRLEDAQAHFGDLDRLDQELRQSAIKLQRAP
ncbi:MAG: DUF1570 domain-containing protein [Isosphaeraceae bacterium]